MAVMREIDAFTEQMFDKWQKVGTGFKGSFMERPLTERLYDFYLQFRYISEADVSIFLDRPDKVSIDIAHRQGEIVRKLLLGKEWLDGSVDKITVLIGKSQKELKVDEFLDIILSSISSMIEHYVTIVKNQNYLNLVKLAGVLGFDQTFIGKLSKQENLDLLFEKLAEETNKKYICHTSSIFSKQEYQIRCGCFHADYTYSVEKDTLYITFGGASPLKMSLEDFVVSSINLVSKLNILTTLPYYFFTKSLPLKGYPQLI